MAKGGQRGPELPVGLTSAEAERRFAADGPNELPSAKPRTVLDLALEVLKEPMLLLLVAAGSVNLVLGDVQDGVILMSFVVVVMAITFFQERRTERALEALRELSSPRALVVRDGAQRRIPGREVVRGDVVLLAEGDRVPADGVLLDSVNVFADESLLTGESAAVRKSHSAESTQLGAPGGEGTPFVFSGTLVVRGQGIEIVKATGADAELGKIGKAIAGVEGGRSPLQVEVARLVGAVLIVGIALCLAVIIVFGLTRQNWLEGTLAGITLAMALLPEEFPVVLTIFLALGAWRLSQRNVLVRRMPSIETLGAATVLCVDKTGTLTQNRMTVKDLLVGGQVYAVDSEALPEQYHEIVEYSILASPVDPFDPMDLAFKQLGERYLARTEHIHSDWRLVREYPLSERLLALSHVWRSPDGSEFVIAAKGAPESIADLCHFDDSRRAVLTREVSEVADRGHRVLGVARATFAVAEGLPAEQHDFDFEFIGLVGLQDPVREKVPAAVQEAYRAGIRVVMITGDYPGTAMSIAREIGLQPSDRFITGPELAEMSDETLVSRIEQVSVFARVAPQQKLRIVSALKSHGEVVAMTGDGVNDAPALKSADIGIAMGERGTDVAREAAAIVLTDDDFSSIVGAVRQGRRVYDNLRKAMSYIIAVHVPIAAMSLVPVLGGPSWPLVLLPVHIAFLELIIDPACSTVFESEGEEPGIMERPPRDPDERLFTTRMFVLSILMGAAVFVAVFGVYWWAFSSGRPQAEVRALTFATLVIANLALILVNRSWTSSAWACLKKKNPAFSWVFLGASVFLALFLTVGALRNLFRFAPITLGELGLAVAASLLAVAWFELYKLWRRIRPPRRGDRKSSARRG